MNLVIAVLCLVWGSTWVVIRGGLEHLPPLTSAAARFVIAALVMTALAPILARREGGRAPRWSLSFILGLLNFGASYAIVYRTETVLPSGLVSVLWGVFPMLSAAAGHLFLGERLGLRQGLGFAVGFVGVAVLFVTDVRSVGPGALAVAAVLLVSPIVSVIGTTVAKRTASDVSSILLNRNAMWIGGLTLSVSALLTERGASVTLNPAAIGSVLYLAVAGTVVTFGLYFWALRIAPANKLSLIAYITPAIAVWFGWLVYDEPITWTLLLGSGLIVVGVALAGKRSLRRG